MWGTSCSQAPIPVANGDFQLAWEEFDGQWVSILTFNRAFSGWGEIFGGDVVVAAAMIDCLVHYAEVISLKGVSYRLKGMEALTDSATSPSEHIPSQP